MTTLPKDALTFMGELAENNYREWFETQKPRFKTNETAVKAFAQALQEKMNVHDRVDGFKLFRVYRDVRFSKDKTPYKTHSILSKIYILLFKDSVLSKEPNFLVLPW